MGFSMILYPATILFQATRAIQRAAERLRAGKPLDKDEAVDMKSYLKVVELEHWQEIEKKYKP
jgi:2-methylisocitrate lyase-like PEP mutase family enzyme